MFIMATLDVFQGQQTLNALAAMDTEWANVKATAPDIFPDFTGLPGLTGTSPDGYYKLTAVLTALTLPEFASTATLPVHGLNDLNFYLGTSATYSDSLHYTDSAGTKWTAQTYGGWFVQHCNSGCGILTDSIPR